MASRHPTRAQINAAGQREFAVLWQRLPAGRIFPASVGYVNSLGADTTATLVGIAPQARCAAAVDARAAAVLAAGCLTVLRATYTDASRTALATIGIAVMRSADGSVYVARSIVRQPAAARTAAALASTAAAHWACGAMPTRVAVVSAPSEFT